MCPGDPSQPRSLDLPLTESALQDIDTDLLDYLQTLTPAERLKRHENARQLVQTLRKAGLTQLVLQDIRKR